MPHGPGRDIHQLSGNSGLRRGATQRLREKTVFCFPCPDSRRWGREVGARKGGVLALRVSGQLMIHVLVASLDVVDGNLLAGGVATGLVFAVTVLVELEAAVAVLAGAEGVGLVDLGRVGQLAVRLA